MMISVLVPLLATAASLVSASPMVMRRNTCDNGPTTRNCWQNHRIEDDPLSTWPNTGRTKRYTLNIEEKNLAPDGYERPMMVVNGQYPGPTIEADWGDWLEITVVNRLTKQGTGIHWHGVRQLNNNQADGAISQTECPLAPGESRTYRWQATQHGTGWYHSHYSLQYSDGVLGPIVIHGPRTSNYDIDVGPILLTDWYHQSAFDIAKDLIVNALALPPVQPSGLINGKNTHLKSGSLFSTTFVPGKKHLLRLVNTASESTFRFSIDGHSLTVTAADWVPMKPYTTDSVLLAVGQRIDVIVEANKQKTNYWMRAVPQLSCLALNIAAWDIKGIVRYDSSSTENPKTLPNTILDTCSDEPESKLIPFHSHIVGESAFDSRTTANLLPAISSNLALRWEVGTHTPYNPPKDNPVALASMNAQPIGDSFAPLDVSAIGKDKWVYLIVQSSLPVAHPMHLHGHDIYVMGRGGGIYIEDLSKLKTENPARRDTVLLPALGWVVLAFKTDNPGAWLLHCHIAFHLHHGFARSVVERKDEIKGVYGSGGVSEMNRVCGKWKASGLENSD